MENRSADEVFKAHLELRLQGNVEEDITQNYSPDVVLISNHGIFRGHSGVRESAALLQQQLPDPEITYNIQENVSEMAYLVWSGKSTHTEVSHGVDSFLIREGKILVQTIFYDLESAEK